MAGNLAVINVPPAGLNWIAVYDEMLVIPYPANRYFRLLLLDAAGTRQATIPFSFRAGSDRLTFAQVWRNQIWPHIMESSDTPIWGANWQIIVQVSAAERFAAADLRQAFRDGDRHCVFAPIRTHYETKLAFAAGDATRAKLRTSLARLGQLETQFRAGVPESALEYVARRLAVRIHLSDPFGNHERRFNDDDARHKIFRFRNVRFNHVEESACETAVAKLSADEMVTHLDALREQRSFYVYKRTSIGKLPTRIDSRLGRYVLDDPDRDVFQSARDKYCLDGYAIDAIKEPLLAKFVGAGLRVTSHVRFHDDDVAEDDPEEYGVLDLSKAYTRGADCGGYFVGYLAGISNVRAVSAGIDHVRAHPGIYQIANVSLTGCGERVHDYAAQLHLAAGSSLVLPSPELLWWWDHGARFDVRGGAWGTVLPDIDWAGLHLLEAGTGPLYTGISRYKIWCGQLGYSNDGVKSMYLPGDSRWAAVLAEHGYTAVHFRGDSEVCVKLPAARTPELKHVFAFITSYTRINVLNKLLEFDPQDVRGVMLDAIVHVGDAPPGTVAGSWVVKPTAPKAALDGYGRDGWYGTTGLWETPLFDALFAAGASPITQPLTFLEGAGGSGKSHSVLNDKGFRDVLFAAPTWSLVCFMMRKYGVAGTTAHRLAGEWIDADEDGHERVVKCRPYHEEARRYPSVVFVDEATMIDRRMLERIVELYSGKTQLIVAGDIRVTDVPAHKPPVWFQCRNRTRVFDPRAVGCAIVSYTTDYRASGPLVQLKRQLRNDMLRVFLESTAEDPGDDEIDAHSVAAAARGWFASSVCTAATCEAEYEKGDTILVGTHELADEWAARLDGRDERYRVTSHSAADVALAQRGENVSLTGDIIDAPGDRTCIFALAFTIHSFQGKTFTGRRLWIDARRAWDYAMLYTAISRCQTISQIRIFFE